MKRENLKISNINRIVTAVTKIYKIHSSLALHVVYFAFFPACTIDRDSRSDFGDRDSRILESRSMVHAGRSDFGDRNSRSDFGDRDSRSDFF